MADRDRGPNPFYQHVLLPPIRYATQDDAEVAMDAHILAMKLLQRSATALRLLAGRHRPTDPILAQQLMDGLCFPHPVGIAAGLDKNAAVYPAFQAHYSPGFIEVGTVTLQPQPGNPRPRITRLGSAHLLNSMGFPNAGVRVVADHLASLPPSTVPLGANIGKNKLSPVDGVAAEYAAIVRRLHAGYGARPDYFVINISSPNTPGLRALQEVRQLTDILAAVVAEMERPPGWSRRRLLVKFGPDLAEPDLEALLECVLRSGIGGVVLTNTRPTPGGGISGSDLFADSSRAVRSAAAVLPADRVIVATGGVDTVERAYQTLQYADLIGAYTGLVLKGPSLLRHLSAGVAERMRADGVGSLPQLRAGNRSAVTATPEGLVA